MIHAATRLLIVWVLLGPAATALASSAACLLSPTPIPAPAPQEPGGEWNLLQDQMGGIRNSQFGSTVSGAGDLDSDGVDDFLVGDMNAAFSGLSSSGACYAYSGATGLRLYFWKGAAVGDFLGSSLAGGDDVNGDGVPDILLGAFRAGLSGGGTVYVHSGADGSLLYRLDGPSPTGRFGVAVALAGDTDGDGLADILVGAMETSLNGGLSLAGSAFLYSGATGALLHRWDGTSANDRLGISVAGAGDLDGDGMADILVGADWNGANGGGYVLVLSGATGATLAVLDGPFARARFGSAVAGFGDVDGDGWPDFGVGAPDTNVAGLPDAGAVYVFSGGGGDRLQSLFGNAAKNNFGTSLAGPGDLDGDGFADIVVGAPHEGGPPGSHSGAVHVFSGRDGVLRETLWGPEAGDRLGAAVAGGGDQDGDGLPDLVLAAPGGGGYHQNGRVQVQAFHPFLRSSATSLSASATQDLVLELDFPVTAAGNEYRLLISASGKGPFHAGNGVWLPLTADPLAWRTWRGDYSLIRRHFGTVGFLDADGDGSIQLGYDAGDLAAYLGRTAFLAVLTLAPGGPPSYSSAAVVLDIRP